MQKNIKELLYSNYQGVKRLFVFAYDNTAGDDWVSVDSYQKYLLPRVKIENYNIEIDGKKFHDEPINDSENYQQNKVMIRQLIVYWIFIILKKITD